MKKPALNHSAEQIHDKSEQKRARDICCKHRRKQKENIQNVNRHNECFLLNRTFMKSDKQCKYGNSHRLKKIRDYGRDKIEGPRGSDFRQMKNPRDRACGYQKKTEEYIKKYGNISVFHKRLHLF